jgi:hypothetical protein
VPERNGTLTIPAITLNWWNVAQNQPEQAKVPARTLEVSGVVAGSSAPAAPALAPAPAAAPAAPAAASPPPGTGASPDGWWREVALASVALWVLLVVAGTAWWLSSRRRTAAPAPAGGDAASDALRPEPESSATTNPQPVEATQHARVNLKALQRDVMDAARAGDPARCERALLAWARACRGGIVNTVALRDALSDPAQCTALDALQRARWQGADAGGACAGVLRAFAPGFEWRGGDKPAREHEPDLPPLYPS